MTKTTLIFLILIVCLLSYTAYEGIKNTNGIISELENEIEQLKNENPNLDNDLTKINNEIRNIYTDIKKYNTDIANLNQSIEDEKIKQAVVKKEGFLNVVLDKAGEFASDAKDTVWEKLTGDIANKIEVSESNIYILEKELQVKEPKRDEWLKIKKEIDEKESKKSILRNHRFKKYLRYYK